MGKSVFFPTPQPGTWEKNACVERRKKGGKEKNVPFEGGKKQLSAVEEKGKKKRKEEKVRSLSTGPFSLVGGEKGQKIRKPARSGQENQCYSGKRGGSEKLDLVRQKEKERGPISSRSKKKENGEKCERPPILSSAKRDSKKSPFILRSRSEKSFPERGGKTGKKRTG